MKTPTLFAQFITAAVLLAPLSVLAETNDDTVRDLKLTQYVEPVFPESVKLDGVAEGQVVLAVNNDAAGVPGDVLVLSSTHPKLSAAAVEAVKQWRFAPATGATTRILRLGFRYNGIIYAQTARDSEVTSDADTSSDAMHSPVKVLPLQSLSQVPKPLAQPMPAYPVALAAKGQEGRAAVRFYVDEEGRVRLPEVIDATSPEFAAAAVAAVSQWRYEPPRSGGRNVVAADRWAFKFAAAN